MSDDGPEWFAPKRFGYGAGLPITLAGLGDHDRLPRDLDRARVPVRTTGPLLFIAAVIPITATLLVIAAKTTRGGWRWRWGEGRLS